MALLSFPYDALFLVFLGTLVAAYVQRRRASNLPYPPGPKGYPIIGNLFDVPTNDHEAPWRAYKDFEAEHGDLVFFKVLGQPMLVLNSMRRVKDLLEKRAKVYSDRPRLPMLIELMNWDYNMALLPYGPWWRRHRRLFHEHFQQNAVGKYKHIQIDEARALLGRLLNKPVNLNKDIRMVFAGTIMRIAYGIPVTSHENEYITRAEIALEGAAEAGIPGSFLVDLIPALKYVPKWFPGAGFKKKAERWAFVNWQVRKIPFGTVMDQLKRGENRESVAARLINALPPRDDPAYPAEERLAEDVTGVAYIGGADTTYSTVHAFFFAMVLYPDIMRKAQDEIDLVVGRDRLPDYGDQAALPYVKAMCKELLRWHIVLPLSVAHCTTEDDEYDGYFIPKGTVIFPNTWALLHDPAVFDNPDEFRPERYMKDGEFNPDILDPADGGTFGYGRRICPGRHLAENSLFIIVSNVLAAYNITAPLGSDGKPIKQNFEVTTGLLSYPKPFDCVITPRTPRAEGLIRSHVPDYS